MMTDFIDLDEVLTNPKLPPGWRLIDSAAGRINIAEADVAAMIRSWFELERQWQETQQ
jgi:hypothetical protein